MKQKIPEQQHVATKQLSGIHVENTLIRNG